MNNYELQDKLNRLQRAICCNKPKEVTELPDGNSGNGFVIFEDNLYFWDGDSWEQAGGGGALPTFKTINGETIDDGPGNIVAGGTGLEALNEGPGVGWRLVGQNPAHFGDLGLNAIDLSVGVTNSSTYGATGEHSFSAIRQSTASGSRSIAIGLGSTASASDSICIGGGTASADNSMALNNAVANANISTAIGFGAQAESFGSLVVGLHSTIGVGQDTSSFVLTDEVFKVGNGTGSGSRSDALVIYKNAIQKQGGITATNASAMTPANGMIAYVTDTNGTFTSVGWWGYENGSWKKFTLV